jgi:hypothetical protein
MRLGKYLKVAFLNHWNLLAFLGASAFALLSPAPDVLLPVVAAGEIAYLGMLGTHPKFQRYVDAQEAKKTRETTSESTQQTLDRITSALPPELLARFTELKSRCLELRQIASELKQTSPNDSRFASAAGELSSRRAGSTVVDSLAALVYAVHALPVSETNERRANSGRHSAD